MDAKDGKAMPAKRRTTTATGLHNVFAAGGILMRLFKVYNGPETAHELVFAKNHRQAASIARTIWAENGYRCRHFQVVELCLPESMKEGGEPVGLVYEPATTPKEYRW